MGISKAPVKGFYYRQNYIKIIKGGEQFENFQYHFYFRIN